jgi:hypothetical protein
MRNPLDTLEQPPVGAVTPGSSRALRRLSDQIAASNHKPLSIDDVQRAARDAAASD